MSMTVFYIIGGSAFLFSLVVRQRLRAAYGKWSGVRSASGRPGGQVARIILDANDLRGVGVETVRGVLTDHYDPRLKRIRLALARSTAASGPAACLGLGTTVERSEQR